MFFGNTLNFVAAVGGLCTFCCFGNSIEEKYLQNIPRGNFHEKCKNSTTSLFRYWLQLFGKHKLVTNALFKQARKSDKSLLLASQHALELMCVTVTESWLADRVAKTWQPNLLWPNLPGPNLSGAQLNGSHEGST